MSRSCGPSTGSGATRGGARGCAGQQHDNPRTPAACHCPHTAWHFPPCTGRWSATSATGRVLLSITSGAGSQLCTCGQPAQPVACFGALQGVSEESQSGHFKLPSNHEVLWPIRSCQMLAACFEPEAQRFCACAQGSLPAASAGNMTSMPQSWPALASEAYAVQLLSEPTLTGTWSKAPMANDRTACAPNDPAFHFGRVLRSCHLTGAVLQTARDLQMIHSPI